MGRIINTSNMKMLFLDDSITRQDFLCGKKHNGVLRWKPHVCKNEVFTVTHVYTSFQAICQLENQDFDLISLDYDLFLAAKLDPEVNNGLTVVQFIINNPYNNVHVANVKDAEIFIHSWNREKRDVMYNLLTESGFYCHKAHFFVA